MGDETKGARPLKIIYIGGYSRSGSTLLLRLLAESLEVTAVGELFDVWNRSYRENQLCGCGLPFRECPFWTAVSVQAFGREPADVPAEQLEARRHRVQGYAAIPLLWWPMLRTRTYRRRLASYADLLGRLYRAISDASDGHVIVDSSKVPQFAWILAEIPGVELHMVHLVRDSRAAAFSWRRRKIRPEISWQEKAMDRHSVLRSGLEWSLFNLMLRSRRRVLSSYSLIRYEDMVRDPAGTLQAIAAATREPVKDLHLSEEGSVTLRMAHTTSGNPGRFDTGPVTIRRDDAWRHEMPPWDRLLVTALTAGGLRRYGYEARAPAAGDPSNE